MREIRTLRSTWRGVETWHGRHMSAQPARQSSTLPVRSGGGNVPTYSAESVLADVELPRVPRVRLRRPEGRLADHDRFAEEPVCVHCTPQRPLGGRAYRVGRHWQIGNDEALKVARPSLLVGKSPPLVRRQSLDQRSGQGMFAHVLQGRVVNHIVGVTGAQQVEKVEAALATCRAEPGEVVIADLRSHRASTAVSYLLQS
jgi:hypothetical protein